MERIKFPKTYLGSKAQTLRPFFRFCIFRRLGYFLHRPPSQHLYFQSNEEHQQFSPEDFKNFTDNKKQWKILDEGMFVKIGML